MMLRHWFQMRIAVRCGRWKCLLQLPPDRWQWRYALLVVALLMGYVVGAVPTYMAMERSSLMPWFKPAFDIFYFPLIWLSENSEWAKVFFAAESEIIEWLSGG